jgi:hypothetical protein
MPKPILPRGTIVRVLPTFQPTSLSAVRVGDIGRADDCIGPNTWFAWYHVHGIAPVGTIMMYDVTFDDLHRQCLRTELLSEEEIEPLD